MSIVGLFPDHWFSGPKKLHLRDLAWRGLVGAPEGLDCNRLGGPAKYMRVDDIAGFVAREADVFGVKLADAVALESSGLDAVGTFAVDLPRARLIDALAVRLHPCGDAVEHSDLFRVDGAVGHARHVQDEGAVLADGIEAGVTPVAADRPYRPAGSPREKAATEEQFDWNSPTAASSSVADHPSRLIDDGDPSTFWSPQAGDADPWVSIDPERILQCHRLQLTFPQEAGYGFVAEIETTDGKWEEIASEAPGADTRRVREIETRPLRGKRIRIKVHPSNGIAPALSELALFGAIQTQ